jgi:hypothetical protein
LNLSIFTPVPIRQIRLIKRGSQFQSNKSEQPFVIILLRRAGQGASTAIRRKDLTERPSAPPQPRPLVRSALGRYPIRPEGASLSILRTNALTQNFRSTRRDARYCSGGCRQDAYRMRREAEGLGRG